MADNSILSSHSSSTLAENIRTSPAEVAANLRALTNTLTGELISIHSLVMAFKLAAQADDGGGDAVLYWPDLMQALLDKIPEPEFFQRSIDLVVTDIVSMNMSIDTKGASAAPQARSRETLATKARVES